ncbi:MAG: hypothetical protein ABI797_07765 [Chloroflexota bacterium]
MKRLIWLPLAGFLLVAGAAVAAAAPSVVDSAKGLLAAADPNTSSDPATGEQRLKLGGDLLETVLADLVSNGTITQAQSDAITTGLQTAIDDKRAEMEARRALISGFVEDGVITQDEINQLPDDDPLRTAFNSIADDGQISLDQLRDLGPGFGPGGPGHHGPGPGLHIWGPDPNADTSNES